MPQFPNPFTGRLYGNSNKKAAGNVTVPIDASRGLPAQQRLQDEAAAAAWRRSRQGAIGSQDVARLYNLQKLPNEDGKLDDNELRMLFLFQDTGLVQAEDVDPNDPSMGQKLGYGIPGDYRFGGKTGQMAQGGAQLRNTMKNARLLQGLSIDQALGFLVGLNEDELTKLQLQMVDAGMYGDDKPNLGMMDDTTTKAFTNMMRYLVRNPDMTVGDALDKATRGQSARLQGLLEKKMGTGESAAAKRAQLKLLQPEITDAQTLTDMVDSISQDLLGTNLPEGRKTELINSLRQKQYDEFMQTTYRQAEIDIANDRPVDAMGTGSDVDLFMQAIMGQESGGDPNALNPSGASGLFQIMPGNWVPWAREAGADPNDHSAANQIKIAKFQMLKYYETFGNWRDVAVAWYAGPGAVGSSRYSTADQNGYPSINEYAQQAMDRFSGMKATGGYQAPILRVEPHDALNVSSEAKKAIMAGNSQEYAGHQFQKAAKDFMSLLAGVM